MVRTEEGREHLNSSIKTVWASAMLHFARHLLSKFLYVSVGNRLQECPFGTICFRELLILPGPMHSASTPPLITSVVKRLVKLGRNRCRLCRFRHFQACATFVFGLKQLLLVWQFIHDPGKVEKFSFVQERGKKRILKYQVSNRAYLGKKEMCKDLLKI